MHEGIIIDIYMARNDTLVAAYTLKGKLVKTYPSCREAARCRHVYKRSIDRATRGDVLTIKGLQWRRVDALNIPECIEPLKKERHSNIKKSVAKVDENNNILEIYASISEASKKNNIDPHTLRDRLSGKYSSKNKDKFIYIS